MARPSKRSSLATLPRTRLLELADGFELEHRRSGKKAELVDAIARSKRASFEKVLGVLSRDELKDICRAHGLDDSGRAKQGIIERILGSDDAPALPNVFEEEAIEQVAEGGTPTLRSVLAVLRKRQLLALAEDYELHAAGVDDKSTLVAMVADAPGITLPDVLDLLGRDDLRRICGAHELSQAGRQRDELIERIVTAAADWQKRSEVATAVAQDAALPAPPEEPRPAQVSPDPSAESEAKTAAPSPPVVRSIPLADPRQVPGPGELVHVRHRQYLVEAVHRPSDSKQMTRIELVCLDDDNQGRKLEVLWELELGARRLNPAHHGLGQVEHLDPPRHFAAYFHAIKWNCVTATRARLFQAPFRAGIQVFHHQLSPLRKALELPRANLFIADDVGLGKTVEAGLVMQELLLRQRLDFILIAVPAAITLQWRHEMERRFGLHFEIYNRAFVARRRRERGFGVNPWSTHNRFIISYQTLRRPEYRDPLLQVLGEKFRKSMLVLDEAHTVAPSSASKYAVDSNLTKVARDIAPRFENRLFLSATPHNGHSNSFSALLEILDPQRFTRGVKVKGPSELEPIMVRRLKKDLRATGTGGESFPERRLIELELEHRNGTWWQRSIEGDKASDPESIGEGSGVELQLSELLAEYAKQAMPEKGRGRLVFINLQKRLLSSVEAFFRTLNVHAAAIERAEAQLAELAEAEPSGPQPELALDEETYGRDDDAEIDDAVHSASRALEDRDKLPGELLAQMLDLARKHRGEPGAKSLALLAWIRRHQCPDVAVGGAQGGKGTWTDRRLLIFTEYADTKRYLQQFLTAAVAGTDQAHQRIATLHGGMSDEGREEVQRAFNADPAEYPVRILIATDAAREGVNLQGACADLIHFDIPWNPARLEQRNGRIDRTLQPSPQVRCMYFTQPQRPEDRVLSTLVRKVARIQEELGSLSQVVMDRIDAVMEDGIDEGTSTRLDDAESAGAAGREVAAHELEAQRAEQQKLREEIELCGQMEDESRRQMRFDPLLLKDAIDVGCELTGVAPLEPAKSDDGTQLWKLPEFPPSWAHTLDSLRPPRARDEDWGQWRRRPLLPVAYEAGKHMSLDRVHLHLQHPFVQRMLSRFLAQGYSVHDLARATVVRTKYTAAARVVAFGRLSLFGRGATRLHDQVIPVVAPWLEGKGKTHLQPFVSDADREALIRFEDALREAPSLQSIPEPVRRRLIASAGEDFAALWTHLEELAAEEEASARKLLAQRGQTEAEALRRILDRQQASIEETLAEGAQIALQLEGWEKDQQRQFQQDQKYMRGRLERLEREREEEPAQIVSGYEVVARRLEPLGLVYLWPHNR